MRFFLLLTFYLIFSTVAIGIENFRDSCSSKLTANRRSRTSRAGIQLDLYHPRSRCSPSFIPSLPFYTVLQNDDIRVHSLSSRIFKKSSFSAASSDPNPSNSDISAPLTPGASFGVGNYVAKIKLGTPSKSYVMVVDTGSSLTWLQCSPCNVSCHDQVGPIFDPLASKSYSSISCSASECSNLVSATLNPSGCSQNNVCVYEASYGDSSFSVGYLSKDTLKLGSLSVHNFVYGCGQDNEGLFGKAAGLIGLAKNELSFLTQVSKKAGAYAFSYCLPTTSSSGVLSLGPYAASKFTFTPMLKNSLDDTLYFIKLHSINMDDKPLHVSSSSYDTPTIIDSGTVITRLPTDAYSALKNAVKAAMKNRKYKSAPAYSILDTCFLGSVDKIAFPEISMVFEGDAEIKLPARNVMIDVSDTTTCLAFAEAGRVAIIGNRQQQTFSVVYDVGKKKIGFAANGCG